MTIPLTEALLSLTTAILLWSVTELWKLSKVVSSLQTHAKDTDRRIAMLEDRVV